MIREEYEVEFITPCFCAGADQSKAEVRAPSIRGQLRWWFRVLGGSYEQEKRVFGGVHDRAECKEKGAMKSQVTIRVSGVQNGPGAEIPFSMNPNTEGAYIWYYASVSGDKKRWWQNGRRGDQNPEGHLAVGTKFILSVHLDEGIRPADFRQFKTALECFLRFGGLGMRLTRGMGAVFCPKFSGDFEVNKKVSEELLHSAGFDVYWHAPEHSSWVDGIIQAEQELKGLRSECSSNSPSRLGSSKPRQTSAVYFRVVKLGAGVFRLLRFEAPRATRSSA
jgi:CRISPR-associated protein Cmr1